MAVHQNTAPLGTGFQVSTNNPVDNRTIVDYKSQLIDASVWEITEFYNGLPIYVKETDEVYYLINKDGSVLINWANPDLTTEEIDAAYACWQKMASYKDLDKAVHDLGPVFVFKGIASGLTPDRRGITVGDASYKPSTTGGQQHKIICLGFEYEFPDKYYAWGTVDASNNMTVEFYTNSSVIANDSSQYKRAKNPDTSIYYVDDTSSGKRFYFDGSISNVDPSKTESNTTMWKFTDEGDISTIYCVANPQADAPSVDVNDVSFYLKNDTRDAVYGKRSIAHFDSYKFTKLSSQGTIVASQVEVIYASNDNNGWVYQISDDEYASNGLIWVQLGSPDNEWVII